MRQIVSALLLVSQLLPLAGALFCRIASGADGERMEAGCPMPEARSQPGESDPSSPDPLVVTGLPQSLDCVFAALCINQPAVRPARQLEINTPTHFDAGTWSAEHFPPIENRAPPVPPPRL